MQDVADVVVENEPAGQFIQTPLLYWPLRQGTSIDGLAVGGSTVGAEVGIAVGIAVGGGVGIVGIIVGAAVGYKQHPADDDKPVRSEA